MLVGLSRDKEAYLEVLRYLEQCYPGYSADQHFNILLISKNEEYKQTNHLIFIVDTENAMLVP